MFGLDFQADVSNEVDRREKSLLNTFPFNVDHQQGHNHGQYQGHHHEQQTTNPRPGTLLPFREGGNEVEEGVTIEDFIVDDGTTDDEDVEVNTVAVDGDLTPGRKCIDKVRESKDYSPSYFIMSGNDGG